VKGPDRPADPGLQAERTRLSWQRTMLSSLGFSMIVARLVAIYSIPGGIAVAAASAIAAAAVGIAAHRRYQGGHLAAHGQSLMPDGRFFAAMASLLVVSGIAAGAFSILHWSSRP